MILEQLRAAQAKRHAAMQAILTASNQETGLTADEASRYDALEVEFERDSKQIERLEKAEQRNSYMNEETTTTVHQRHTADDRTDESAIEYKSAFIAMVAGRATTPQMEMLNERAVQISGDGTEGGFLVPTEFQNTILEKLDEMTSLRKLATVVKTTSEKEIPVGSDTPEFGWIDELGDYPEGDLAFGKYKLGAHKAGGVILASREVINDSSTNIEAYIQMKMVKGLSKLESTAFVSGNGVKKPTGITATADIGLTTTSSSGITLQELTKFKYSVPAQYRKNAKWLISDAFALAVENLVDGNGVKLWQPSMVDGVPDKLLGFPVEYDENLGDVSPGQIPAVFGDISHYHIGDRGSIYVQILREKYATKGAIGVLVDKRTDGKLANKDAVKTLKIAD